MTEDAMWAELVRRWLPADPVRPTPEYEAVYRLKYRIAAGMADHVTSVFEIGVRAGYSAFALLAALPTADYLGWDNDAGDYGGIMGYCHQFVGDRGRVALQDSQVVDQLPRAFDLAHIDGDHSYDGAAHDIALCAPWCRYVLVDDYDFIRPVQAAVDHFIVSKRGRVRYQHFADGGFRGSMLLDCTQLQRAA